LVDLFGGFSENGISKRENGKKENLGQEEKEESRVH